jgi:hypothetical protein
MHTPSAIVELYREPSTGWRWRAWRVSLSGRNNKHLSNFARHVGGCQQRDLRGSLATRRSTCTLSCSGWETVRAQTANGRPDSQRELQFGRQVHGPNQDQRRLTAGSHRGCGSRGEKCSRRNKGWKAASCICIVIHPSAIISSSPMRNTNNRWLASRAETNPAMGKPYRVTGCDC